MNLAVKKIYGVGAGLVLLLALIGVILIFLQRHFAAREHVSEVAPEVSPRRQLEFELGQDVKELRRRQLAELGSYGRAEDGFAQVPIEHAMNWMVDHHVD